MCLFGCRFAKKTRVFAFFENNINGYVCGSFFGGVYAVIPGVQHKFTVPCLIARARSSFHPTPFLFGWGFTSLTLRGITLRVRCTFQDVEVICFALPPKRVVVFLWFDRQFTSCHHVFVRWPKAIVNARCSFGCCNFWGPEFKFASIGRGKVEST